MVFTPTIAEFMFGQFNIMAKSMLVSMLILIVSLIVFINSSIIFFLLYQPIIIRLLPQRNY